MRIAFGKLIKIIFIIIIAAILSGVAAWEINDRINNSVRLTEYSVKNPEIPKAFDGFKIFMISDLHNAPFDNAVNMHIDNTAPDIIVLTGDMNQLPEKDTDRIIAVADRVKDTIPVYAVSGNHEIQHRDYKRIIRETEKAGVHWLENEHIHITEQGERITLMGIKDPLYDLITDEMGEKASDAIKKEIEGEDEFSVLLSHRADLYPYIKDSGADLILSGHLHGGIIRLPFVGGIIGDGGRLELSDYDYGYIREGDSATMIVSGGCDKNPEKMRWFNQPEVLLITLESE